MNGTWTFDTSVGVLQLYATCPQCGRPNNISEHYVSASGKIKEECVVCPRCSTHFFPELIGWRKSFANKIGVHVAPAKRKEGK